MILAVPPDTRRKELRFQQLPTFLPSARALLWQMPVPPPSIPLAPLVSSASAVHKAFSTRQQLEATRAHLDDTEDAYNKNEKYLTLPVQRDFCEDSLRWAMYTTASPRPIMLKVTSLHNRMARLQRISQSGIVQSALSLPGSHKLNADARQFKEEFLVRISDI